MSMENNFEHLEDDLKQLDTVVNKVKDGKAIVTLNEIRHDEQMNYKGHLEVSENVIERTRNNVYFGDKYATVDFIADKKDRNDLLMLRSTLELYRNKFSQAIRNGEKRIFDLNISLCQQEESTMYRMELNKPIIFFLDDSDERYSVLKVLYEKEDVLYGIQQVDMYKLQEEYELMVAEKEEELKREIEREEYAESRFKEDDNFGYEDGYEDIP